MDILDSEKRRARNLIWNAAGDIRHKPVRQVVTAAADGAVAAGSCEAFLRQRTDP